MEIVRYGRPDGGTTLVCVLALALSLGACQTTSGALGSVNKTLAQLANNDLPAACGIEQVAYGYFTQLRPSISGANQALAQKAQAAAVSICNGPAPSNIPAALIALGNAWIAVQSATKAS